MNLAWHFVATKDGKPVLRDGRPLPAVGEWLVEPPPIRICEKGLHASRNALDAINYRPAWSGLIACLVEVDDIAEETSDKMACSRRRIIGQVACDDILRLFAREAALSVLHLWRGKVPVVVKKYLETGEETIRANAYAAANAAVHATGAAAYAAAYAAYAANAANAAADAAYAAAADAANAAYAAANAAYAAAANAAAADAANAAYAAADAAWQEHRDKMNTMLESMLLNAMDVSL